MAPGYRNQSRRNNNRGVDHDTLEGLPVRHWRRDFVTVAPPPAQENSSTKNDKWAIELPHGMPKDYHLLPQHSQDLLRAARSGRIYKRPRPVDDDDVEPEVGERTEKKEDDPKDKGFQAKAWKQVPRHLEGPDIEYLAPKRRGLVPKIRNTTIIPTVTKATVKRVDAAGNEYVQDVVVPHGQQVEGELISQTEIPDPTATAVLPVQPTPPRRKPVKSKKAKGPGRGRKKQPLAPTSVPGGGQPVPLTGEGTSSMTDAPSDGNILPSQREDVEMADGSQVASDNDDNDDSDDGEDGDDDEGSVDNQDSPSKPPHQEFPVQQALPLMTEIPMLVEDTTMSGMPSPPRPVLSTDIDGKSGSPLKNVAMVTSALASPLEVSTDGNSTPLLPVTAPIEQDSRVADDLEIIDEVMQQEVAETAPPNIPSPPPHPTIEEVEVAKELLQEEEAEEEMLIDIVEGNNAYYAEPPAPETLPLPSEHPAEPEPTATKLEAMEVPSGAVEPLPGSPLAAPATFEVPSEAVETLSGSPLTVPEATDVLSEAVKTETLPDPPLADPAAKVEAEAQDDDQFPDLLGGLEKSLERPVPKNEPSAHEVEVETEASAQSEKELVETKEEVAD